MTRAGTASLRAPLTAALMARAPLRGRHLDARRGFPGAHPGRAVDTSTTRRRIPVASPRPRAWSTTTAETTNTIPSAVATDARDSDPADAPVSSPADAPADPAPPRGAVMWFRQDLRLADNQAFRAAAKAASARGGELLCVYVWSEDEEGDDDASWGPGEASRVWLHLALDALDRDMRRAYGGGGIRYMRGPHARALADAAAAVGASTVFATERHEPAHVRGDARVAETLAELPSPVSLATLPGHLLFHPSRVELDMSEERYFFGTLMPFVHAAERRGGKPGVPAPAPAPASVRISDEAFESPRLVDSLDALGVAPSSLAARDWAAGIRAEWDPSEAGATEAWEQFKRAGLPAYEAEHGRADVVPHAVSRLSPYLRFGQISPRAMYRDLTSKSADGSPEGRKLSRLFWHRLHRREFAYWQLHNWPELSTRSVRSHYEGRADWRRVDGDDEDEDSAAARDALRRWRRGETGYPIVDAAMRRLWATGWMHQTERMLAATFLVDHCGVHWTHGARWFHDTLVDADLAINSMMWQNAGKSGLDQWDVFAASLAPDGSSRAHDPKGEAIARWVPELAGLPPGHLRHRPWEASERQLADAGVVLGETYPRRIEGAGEEGRRRMVEGVNAVRLAHVLNAAARDDANEREDEDEDPIPGFDSDVSTSVRVDPRTGADYVLVPPGATRDHGGHLLPLSTRKEFKKTLRASPAFKSAAAAAAAWASRALRVGITGASAAGGEPSADESGRARACDIGKKRSERAARDGTEHSHSHSHGGVEHSHSHGGHSHAPGDAVAHSHIGHTHGGGGGKRAGKGAGKGGRKGGARRAELKSSSWAKGSGGRAARREAAKAEERRKVKAGRREARELAAWSAGMRVDDVGARVGGWEEEEEEVW